MQHVEWEMTGRVATIRLRRPEKHNAITSEMLESITAACAEIDLSPVDIVILGGDGPSFSVGFDLDEIVAGTTARGAAAGSEAIAALVDLRAITVARLHGWVVGGGVALAAACDLRVGDPSVVVRIPEVLLGIPLGWGAMPLLVAELGPSVAKDLVMTGRDMGAEEAHRRNLLTRLSAPGELDEAVSRLVAELSAVPVGSLHTTKRQANLAAVIMRSGTEDTARLVHAAESDEFRRTFARYLERVRPES